MRNLIALLALVFSSPVNPVTIPDKPNREFLDLYDRILQLNYVKLYGYSDQELFVITNTVETITRQHDVNQYLMVAIFEVESSFGTQKLLKTNGVPTDFGWGQIHRQHLKRLKLNPEQLLENDAYSIEASVVFMASVQKSYGREINFYSRYHSYTPKFRRIYEAKVRDALAILGIKKLELGFQKIKSGTPLCDFETSDRN